MEDYTRWSHADLIARVTKLEAELRSHSENTGFTAMRPGVSHVAQGNNRRRGETGAYSSPMSSGSIPSRQARREPKKEPKPLDPSRYHTRVIALKFAYLGARYNGFEHHVGNDTPLPAVEEILWRALRKTRLIFPRFDSKVSDEEQERRAGKLADGWERTQGWHPWLAGGSNGGGSGGGAAGERKEEVCWDGCEYSKCGRTDRGVSAFGQVIGVRVRSSRPKRKAMSSINRESVVDADSDSGKAHDGAGSEEAPDDRTDLDDGWNPIDDELPYIQILNRVLPPDIRVLAWCANPPPEFSARFHCKERRYRYFFTNPAYMPLTELTTTQNREGWLDLAAMQKAAKKLEGLHDFRNFCKIDASKQITNFHRRIFSAGIHKVTVNGSRELNETIAEEDFSGHTLVRHADAELYFFEVRGSAFLWHQVRHMVAILFLVGQGFEYASVVDELLDTVKNPACPAYEMASDKPLVLWDCIFPDPAKAIAVDHEDPTATHGGYEDDLEWIYVGDEHGGQDTSTRRTSNVGDGRYGRNGVMEDVWSLWRSRKIDEILASSLMDSVARLPRGSTMAVADSKVPNSAKPPTAAGAVDVSDRIFTGNDSPISVGRYVPVMQRTRKETADVLNARYAARKGLTTNSRGPSAGAVEFGE